MFKQIEEDEALIYENGVFKPVKVFEGPGGGLFVAAKGGFVRLKDNGSTSVPSVRLESLARDGVIFRDQFGRLCVSGGDGRKPVAIAAGETFKIEDMR